MAEITGYDYDIFISYAHDDNHAPEGQAGWVERFVAALESQLKYRRSFKKLEIWRDAHRMSGNTFFNNEIRKAVEASFLFFAFLSTNYRNSCYCQQELQAFSQFNQRHPRSLRIGNHSRIFNLRLRNIPHEQWPPELQGMSGFELFDATSKNEMGFELEPGDKDFSKQLRQVVDAVEKIFAHPDVQPPPQPDALPSSEFSVFFADVADSLRSQRKQLIAEAESWNITPIHKIPPPWPASEHTNRVSEVLQEAQLSIHLFNEWPGREIEDQEDTTYAQVHLRQALACSIPQLIWVPKELKPETIEDPAHRNLLEDLETGDRQGKNYKFMRCNPTELKNYLKKRIEDLQSQVQQAALASTFLVDTHQKDQLQAFQLAQMLMEQGQSVEFSRESFDPIRSLDLFADMAQRVENLIFLFGKVDTQWLRRRIEQVVNIVAAQLQTEDPAMLENVWILKLKGAEDSKPLPKFPRLLRIRTLDNTHSTNVDPACLTQLLHGETA